MEAAWWPAMAEPVHVISREDLWGTGTATVIVPSTRTVERISGTELEPLTDRTWLRDEAAWRAARGLVLRSMAGGEPLAVAQGGVEPLPHQLAVLERAMATDPLRLLLADEVGLGKTIEAGLIISELKARGLIGRILVIAPKGVQLQWVAEMAERFGEEFVLVGPEGVPVGAGIDPWLAFDQVVCSLDTVKPLRTRAGWSPERIDEHNRLRVQAVVEAGWDLVVIDEAHHVSGSSEDVARHVLARRLATATPRLLLLSATPHSGKSEAFARLLGLLEPAFLDGRPVRRESVQPLVVRTEKRDARDSAGGPLFQPRTTRLVTVPYGSRRVERSLYESVTDYVRHGYRRAQAEKRPAVGFLVLLMQRLVSSSTAAILASLERRLVAVTTEGQQLRLFTERSTEWGDLSGEEQVDALANATGAAWGDERAEVELLVDLARKSAAEGMDVKARHLLNLLGELARTEGDSGVKVVVFTEFVPTQAMLLDVLAGAGIPAVAVNGSMSIEERRLAQEEFAASARVLVSTDAGGEGVNLQFAHVVVNYDLPWSPTRIEQRIGRVDRIGQLHPVSAHNLVLESSVDARVLEVLEEKLSVILAELGVDKAGDVLESVGRGIDDLYTAAILDPDSVESAAAAVDKQARDDIRQGDALADLFGPPPVSKRTGTGALARWLQLTESSSRALLKAGHPDRTDLPEVVPGEPVPRMIGAAPGWWTMWQVDVDHAIDCLALFVADGGAVRPDLSERVWAEVAEGIDTQHLATLDQETFNRLRHTAVDHAFRDVTDGVPALDLRLAVRVDQ